MLRTGWVPAFVCVAVACALSAQTAWAASGRPTIGDTSVCAIHQLGQARCLSDEKTVNGAVVASNSQQAIGGFGPSDLQSAYPVGSSGGAGQTVAIVDANDDPQAESDLALYRSHYNLPPCSTANGCFRKVDQTGGSNYPSADTGWAMEISLDLDMVSALCPNCKIVLVEASSSGLDQLGIAINEAVALGAVAVSNSYGACESDLNQSMETGLDAYFNHPGVAITASSGDGGYGSCGYYGGGLASPEYPSVSQYVTAVGGTSLAHSGATWAETVWSGTESGCSQWEPKPSWQTDTGCARRTVADVAAVSDPSTGVAVSDSYSTGTQWEVLGGTSAASPLVAAAYALGWAGGPSLSRPGAQPVYQPATSLRDVTAGSNGSCGAYSCQAEAGYDGPTGMGTPAGPNAAGAPHAGVTAQPATQNTTAFTVSWQPGSRMNVWVRDGNGPWLNWITTTAQSATFYGLKGHTYSFSAEVAGSAIPSIAQTTTTIATSASNSEPFTALYALDGYGKLSPASSPPVSDPVNWPWDIARGITLDPDGAGGQILDGYGGMHPFGQAPSIVAPTYWPGWDIARAIQLVPGSNTDGYILDGWGGIHPFGNAPVVANITYWPGWDIARGFAVCGNGTGGYTLDGFGGVHPWGSATAVEISGYWPGWDIARSIAVDSTCTGGYTLDGWGGIHPFGSEIGGQISSQGFWPGWDIARSVVLLPGSNSAGYVIDGWGGFHPWSMAGASVPPPVDLPGYAPGDPVHGSAGV